MGFQEPLDLTGRSEEVRLEWGNFSWMQTVHEGARKSFLEVAITEAEAGAWDVDRKPSRRPEGLHCTGRRGRVLGMAGAVLLCAVSAFSMAPAPRTPQAGTYSSNCHLPCRLGLALNNLVPTLCLLDGAFPLP